MLIFLIHTQERGGGGGAKGGVGGGGRRKPVTYTLRQFSDASLGLRRSPVGACVYVCMSACVHVCTMETVGTVEKAHLVKRLPLSNTT